MQDFELFRSGLIDRPELYDSSDTFYIRMKNADEETKEAYNKLKNAIMSYSSRTNKDHFVEAVLSPKDETFVIDGVIARFVFVGGQLCVHLKVNPKTQSTRAAMFKVLNENTIAYKLKKKNVVDQALRVIPKMMGGFGYVSSLYYKKEDYASFFSENIEEIAEIVAISQKEYEEKMSIQQPEVEESDYGDYYDDDNELRSVDARFIKREIPEGTPTDEELRAEEKTRKHKVRKPNMREELANYGYNFIGLRYVEFYLATILVGVALGVAYQLNLLCMLLLVVGLLIVMPGIIKSFYQNKYEEKRFNDASNYIEQMLYSFRKNSKILASLKDSLSVFPTGHMHDVIVAAIHAAQTSTSGTNIYSDALRIIEKEYPCRRIRSLHRYMMKVEGAGGDHDTGIEALLKDRRLWVERVDKFKKDAAAVLTDIYISIGFSIGLACLVVRLMSTPLVDIPGNSIYQGSSVIFLLICAITVKSTIKATVFHIEDEETEESTRRILKKMNWIRTYDPQKELLKSFKMSAVFVCFFVAGFILKSVPIMVFAGGALCYAIFLKRLMDKKSAIKTVCRTIEKVYPDWLLELALLLQVDNLHVAIEKTLDSAPLVIRGDLMKLNDDIIKDPTSIKPYVEFLDFLPIPHIHSSMKLLYSMSAFGQADSSVQLMELVERNSILMDRAEQYKNDDRLSTTFALKFVPMGISAVKLLCDLVILLAEYMGILSGL